MNIQTKRIYEEPEPSDGQRILVDQLWPRGISKKAAAIDFWAKELAPSQELRKWFDHQDSKFAEFTNRYWKELNDKKNQIKALTATWSGTTITLLYAAKNKQSNHAIVLKDWLGTYCL